MTDVETLAAEVREQNELYERGEMDRAFWLGQQHRLQQMKETNPSLTQAQIGELISKSDRWVRRILTWDPTGRALPDWNGGSNKRNEVVAKALRDPERRREAIDELPDEELSEVIRTGLEVSASRSAPVDRKKLLGESDEEKAEKTTDRAYWDLRKRYEFYADVPLSEHERALVPVIVRLAERLEQGVKVDDELAAMLKEMQP